MKRLFYQSLSICLAVLYSGHGYSYFSPETSRAAPPYSIKIKVRELPENTVCYLANYYGDKQYIKDSAVTDARGTFIFTGKELLPKGIYMAVLPGKKYFEFLVTEQELSLETDTTDLVAHMKVRDSRENKLFYAYLQYIGQKGRSVDTLRKAIEKNKDNPDIIRGLKEKMAGTDKEVKAYKHNIVLKNPHTLLASVIKATEEIEIPENTNKADSLFAFRYYKTHYFDNIDFSDDAILRTPIYHEKIKYFLENLTLQHPDSINKSADVLVEKTKANKELFKYTVWWITHVYESANWMGADAIFVHMAETYFTKEQAFWLDSSRLAKIQNRAAILRPLLIGKRAPNLILQDTMDRNIPLYAVKAKYTVAVFWDPECSHCQKEVPKVNSFYGNYHAQGVEVYAVNVTHDPKKNIPWKKFIRENNLNWINVHDTGPYYDFGKTYDIYSYPVIYLLDEKKEIVAKRIGADDLPGIIEHYEKALSKY